MEAIESADLLPIRSRLAPEARRIRGEAARQVALAQDFIAEEVGDRYFGCRDHVEAVACDFVHDVFLVGGLSGSGCAVFVDVARVLDLVITTLCGEVEAGGAEGTLVAGTLGRIRREPEAGGLGAA